MIIITEHKTYSEHLLGKEINWIPVKSDIPNSILSLSKNLFPKNNIFFGETTILNHWDFGFITEHSEQSQYDLLIESARTEKDLPDNIFCFAGSGDNFHGFKNRSWVAKSGNIHLSVLFAPNASIKRFPAIFQALPAVSVAQAIDEIPSLKGKSFIKWVNDILINDSKIGGVLAHSLTAGNIVNYSILGIGSNVNTIPNIVRDKFTPKVGAINEIISPDSIQHQSLLLSILEKLMNNYQNLLSTSSEAILNFYKNRLAYKGKIIRIINDEGNLIAEGKLVGVNQNLELILEGRPQPIHMGRLIFMNTDK